MTPKKVSFHTLGCKLNFAETSAIARQFIEGGFVRTLSAKDADLCVVNTCSVTEHADKKCRNLIRRLHHDNPSAIIAVTGCYAQLRPEQVAAIEGVDMVVGNNDKGDLFDRAARLMAKGEAAAMRGTEPVPDKNNKGDFFDSNAHLSHAATRPTDKNGAAAAESVDPLPGKTERCPTMEITRFFPAFSSGDRTRSFLKVQDGCDYRCAYCTIPNARGASRNIAIANLVADAEKMATAGQKEIVITGVNTGDFGKTTGESFIDLLRALERVDGIERYRISSIEPNLLTDEIIEFTARSTKFQHHFHIPLQSGSDAILGLMRRRYTASVFAERCAAIRKQMPDAFIGVDVIVGFPGESEEDFMHSCSLLESTAPAYLHVFPFSERPGTPAAAMQGKVAPGIKIARAEKLGALSERLHRDFYRQNEGRRAEVLFEKSNKGGFMYGFTGNYIKVGMPYDHSRVGKPTAVTLRKSDQKRVMTAVII